MQRWRPRRGGRRATLQTRRIAHVGAKELAAFGVMLGLAGANVAASGALEAFAMHTWEQGTKFIAPLGSVPIATDVTNKRLTVARRHTEQAVAVLANLLARIEGGSFVLVDLASGPVFEDHSAKDRVLTTTYAAAELGKEAVGSAGFPGVVDVDLHDEVATHVVRHDPVDCASRRRGRHRPSTTRLSSIACVSTSVE